MSRGGGSPAASAWIAAEERRLGAEDEARRCPRPATADPGDFLGSSRVPAGRGGGGV